jgi:hypothetical protein
VRNTGHGERCRNLVTKVHQLDAVSGWARQVHDGVKAQKVKGFVLPWPTRCYTRELLNPWRCPPVPECFFADLSGPLHVECSRHPTDVPKHTQQSVPSAAEGALIAASWAPQDRLTQGQLRTQSLEKGVDKSDISPSGSPAVYMQT